MEPTCKCWIPIYLKYVKADKKDTKLIAGIFKNNPVFGIFILLADIH